MNFSLTRFGVKFVFGFFLVLWRVWGAGADLNPTLTTNSNSLSTNQTSRIINATEREFKPHDVFRFAIKEDPSQGSLSQEIVVSDGGEIHIPITGSSTEYITVDIRGKKLLEIRNEIKQKMDENYYQDATISLDLSAVYSGLAAPTGFGKARVFGELKGLIPLPDGEDVWLTDALNSLPDNPMANLKKVKIHRTNKQTKVQSTIEVNVEKILKTNARDKDVKLMDGDRVEVLSRGIVF